LERPNVDKSLEEEVRTELTSTLTAIPKLTYDPLSLETLLAESLRSLERCRARELLTKEDRRRVLANWWALSGEVERKRKELAQRVLLLGEQLTQLDGAIANAEERAEELRASKTSAENALARRIEDAQIRIGALQVKTRELLPRRGDDVDIASLEEQIATFERSTSAEAAATIQASISSADAALLGAEQLALDLRSAKREATSAAHTAKALVESLEKEYRDREQSLRRDGAFDFERRFESNLDAYRQDLLAAAEMMSHAALGLRLVFKSVNSWPSSLNVNSLIMWTRGEMQHLARRSQKALDAELTVSVNEIPELRELRHSEEVQFDLKPATFGLSPTSTLLSIGVSLSGDSYAAASTLVHLPALRSDLLTFTPQKVRLLAKAIDLMTTEPSYTQRGVRNATPFGTWGINLLGRTGGLHDRDPILHIRVREWAHDE
jgi:hypothetical protein